MKKTLLIISAVITLLLVTSCNQDTIDASGNIGYNQTRADDNPIEIDWSALDTTYFVSDKDVEAYIHFKKLVAESEKKEFGATEVVPLGLNDEATLAYLINYNKGWEIIAADKRAPIVLASGEEGQFDLKDAPDNVMSWIESLEADVLHLRTSIDRPDWADNDMWNNMLNSIDFWLAISADENYIISHDPIMLHPDSIALDPPTVGPTLQEGHWELISSTSTTVICDSLRLTKTDWSQGDPNNLYNQYVPYRTDLPNPYIRTAAGCAAVAGAQMLFYLHQNYGYPVYTARHVYCSGDVTNYTMYEHGTSSTIWDNMYVVGETHPGSVADAKDSVAVLIASCGYRLDLAYTNDGGGLRDNNDFKNKLFDTYNIDCSESVPYDVTTIKSELLRRMPVILIAYSEDIRLLGIHLRYEGGHVFLIDGYKRSHVQYTNTYVYVSDDGTLSLDYQPRIEITYSQPTIYRFGMNWGTRFYRYNRYWYELSGDWEYNDANYEFKREMVTGFSNRN